MSVVVRDKAVNCFATDASLFVFTACSKDCGHVPVLGEAVASAGLQAFGRGIGEKELAKGAYRGGMRREEICGVEYGSVSGDGS